MLWLRWLGVQRKLHGRWCNNRRPFWVMRFIRTSSTAIAYFVPSIYRYQYPYTAALSHRLLYSQRHAYHITRTNSVNLPWNRRIRTVTYITRDNREENDEIEDDLYLLAASSESTSQTSSRVQFATSYHAPVMWKECVDTMNSCVRGKERGRQQQAIPKDSIEAAKDESEEMMLTVPKTSLIFVDGTLGGGGHSQALLESLLPGDIVFGADVDPDALNIASQRLLQFIPNSSQLSNQNGNPWFIPVPSNFADLTSTRLLDALMAKCNDIEVSPIQSTILQHIQNDGVLVDGILLDLGVSSYQIDTAERGFAFMKDGPLDMRMDRHGTNMNSMIGGTRMTAADVCNELDISELRRIFQTYGDEPRARVIAESIVRSRPMVTTKDLFEAVAAVTPQFVRKGRRMGRTATLARVFQSLRIVVNQEDVVLERALTKMAPTLLRPGGRLVVLSYHSMEDRATKRVMRDGTVSKREAEHKSGQKDVYGNYIGEPKPFRVIGKAQKATIEEIELNARARSATLRVAERM
jgi:16S rRNA (cytosine1402-N4)-methyltransferase